MHYSTTPPIVFSGGAHRKLQSSICSYLGVVTGRAEVFKFSNDNTFVRILENVRQRDVFIVQPTAIPVNDSIMEMLIMIDAAKRASAGRITAVIPYLSYARTDKKDQPRVPITARLVADLIATAGADRALLFDLHAGQVQGFFSFPVDELTASHVLAEHFAKEMKLDNVVVAATDVGISKKARDFALRLELPLAIVEKRRSGNDEKVRSLNVIGDVKDKEVVLFDDEINSAGTMVAAVDILLAFGARSISACATHGVFNGDGLQKLLSNPKVLKVVVTDTLPQSMTHHSKLHVIPVAPLIGEAIRSIHEGNSVGALFK